MMKHLGIPLGRTVATIGLDQGAVPVLKSVVLDALRLRLFIIEVSLGFISFKNLLHIF